MAVSLARLPTTDSATVGCSMKRFIPLIGQACLLGLFLLGPVWAYAQASRTWVSGVGDDANPCSRTAPCRTLAGALSKTESGGEIDVLDAAALDGGDEFSTPVSAPATLLIDKPITIDGSGGHAAAFGGVPLGDSIVVNLPSNGVVILRNLQLNGFSGIGDNGIRVASSVKLVLDHVDIASYSQNCLLVDAGAAGSSVDIASSTFSNCSTGIANRAASAINLGTDSAVVLNTVSGVSSNNVSGVVYFFNSGARNNARNVDLTTYVNGTSASLSGGGAGCAFASQQFVPPNAVANSLPNSVVAVAGAGFQFRTTDCGAGAVVTVRVQYEQAMPANTVLYKFGPATPGAGQSTWFPVAGAVLGADRKSFTYVLTDNGVGDTNSAVGFIDDPVLPLVPEPPPIPTLSNWALLILSALMLTVILLNRTSPRQWIR